MPKESQMSSPPPTINCTECGDLGWVLGEHGGARKCICALERELLGCVPPRYRTAKLADFSVRIQKLGAKWLKDSGDGLFLPGTPGVGKTHLACALLIEFSRQSRGGLFASGAELYGRLRDCYARNGSELEVLGPLVEADLVVLDDFGAGNFTPHECSVALYVLDHRLNHLRPSIVTTNLSLAEIGDRGDARLASRLSGFTYVELTGPDRRVAGRQMGGERDLT